MTSSVTKICIVGKLEYLLNKKRYHKKKNAILLYFESVFLRWLIFRVIRTLRWNGTLYMDQKVCLSLVKKRPIVCCCTHEQKTNFEGFTQNGCYGNQPQPFEVVFHSIDANTSCSLIKKDLTVKQAYRAIFCFVLWYEPKFCFQRFLQASFGNNLISYYSHWTNHPLSRDRS